MLRASFIDSKETAGNCVMLLHGIKDSRSGMMRYAPMFLRDRYSVLLPDSRAQGASGGEFVTYGLLEKYDAIEWAHWLQQQGCKNIYAWASLWEHLFSSKPRPWLPYSLRLRPSLHTQTCVQWVSTA